MSRFPSMPITALLGLLAAVAATLAFLAGSSGAPTPVPVAHRAPQHQTPRAATAPDTRPNIVYVLTDDLTADLIPYMPTVQAMATQGTQFANYYVSDSLCCPSRASLLTGRYPHSTGIKTNTYPDGGWYHFQEKGEESSTYGTDLHDAGYRTALMGKYLNEYMVTSRHPPPGWDEWAVSNKGYHEVNYTLNVNGKPIHYGGGPNDYLTDVLARRGKKFVHQAARDKQPFFLELSTFAPHGPSTPARRDRGSLSGAQAPRYPTFDGTVTNPPSWLASRPPLTDAEIAGLDHRFELRAESVKAVDRMMQIIDAELVRAGVEKNTYVIFNSDNGFHLGQDRLLAGKMTAFDFDTHVPLIVTGPGVPAQLSVPEIAQNVDLRPTFDEIAGVTPSDTIQGRSLLPLFHGEVPPAWRQTALVEHAGPDLDPSDPDYQSAPGGNPTTYKAIRFDGGLYVESANGEREYYDTQQDPDEQDNVYAALPPDRQAALAAKVAALGSCSGSACFDAP